MRFNKSDTKKGEKNHYSRLREIRDSKGITLKVLSELSGLNVGSLWKTENRQYKPTSIQMSAICKVLDIDINLFTIPDNEFAEIVKVEKKPKQSTKTPAELAAKAREWRDKDRVAYNKWQREYKKRKRNEGERG